MGEEVHQVFLCYGPFFANRLVPVLINVAVLRSLFLFSSAIFPPRETSHRSVLHHSSHRLTARQRGISFWTPGIPQGCKAMGQMAGQSSRGKPVGNEYYDGMTSLCILFWVS